MADTTAGTALAANARSTAGRPVVPKRLLEAFQPSLESPFSGSVPHGDTGSGSLVDREDGHPAVRADQGWKR